MGTWTDEGPIEPERLVCPCLQKAAREQKSWTTWTKPNEEAEEALYSYARTILSTPETLTDCTEVYQRTFSSRRVATLSQKVLGLTLLGVADNYQGQEVVQNSLVDPDNRRPVNYEALSAMLDDLDARDTLPARASIKKNFG